MEVVSKRELGIVCAVPAVVQRRFLEEKERKKEVDRPGQEEGIFGP
jgi:hypothetical protein